MNRINEELYLSRPVLSSLVMNKPYKFDNATSAPVIPKYFALPFGIRTSAASLYKLAYIGSINLVIVLVVMSLILNFIFLPINAQNHTLLASSKVLTNKHFILLANTEETSTYNKLFEEAKTLSLNDAEEVIYTKRIGKKTVINKSNKKKFNQSLFYSGY